jgi:hypothetical protein
VVSSRMTFKVPRKSVIWLKRKLDTHTDFQNKLTPKGKNTHTAERPAGCDLIRGNKSTDLFPRIKSQAAGPCMCVFTLTLFEA